jgi:hypothetical protein
MSAARARFKAVRRVVTTFATGVDFDGAAMPTQGIAAAILDIPRTRITTRRATTFSGKATRPSRHTR